MSPFAVRSLQPVEADAVAQVLRASFDDRLPWLAGRHTAEEDKRFVREHLFPACEIWGAYAPELVGVIAFRQGWVEQLYVLPAWQGQGIGRTLLASAKAVNGELRLWTFQRNLPARRFYEGQGFVATEETDGSTNDEREPDVLYR